MIGALNRPSLICILQEADSFLLFGGILFPNTLWKSKLVKTMTKVKNSVDSVHFSRSRLFVITLWRVCSLFEQKIQGLFRDFQRHISHFSRTPFSAKKSLEFAGFFLLLKQHEQYYPEGLSVFVGLDKVSTEIQGLSSTNCNFEGLLRPRIFILKFNDFQGGCES